MRLEEKTFLTPPCSCLPCRWVTVTVERAFTQSIAVAVCLLYTQTKIQTPSLVDFTKQSTTKLNLKPRSPQIHPEEQLGIWSKNRKVMVKAYAGMPDAAQSRKQKTWSRGLHRSWCYYFHGIFLQNVPHIRKYFFHPLPFILIYSI